MKQTFVAIIQTEIPDGVVPLEFASGVVEQTMRLVNQENLRFQDESKGHGQFGQLTDMQIFSQVP